ncbi:MAG: hypothetical protein KF699_06525 [Phycisphaeraceae bacterium]|nr:hypothetical protein [Phycisphaeraceae bacterium]
MLHPAPTDRIAPTLARGELAEVFAATATKPGHIVITFPNTSYRVHLIPTGEITTPIGKRIIGTIRATARRVDLVETGGKYIEPVYGRPRRVQGRVIGGDDHSRTLIVDAGMPIHCTMTDARQVPSQFERGAMVSFDVLDGAMFTPQ